MAALSEVTELLRRWDVWKRIEETPERVDKLEERLRSLEQGLKHPQKAPGKECPFCGGFEMRLETSKPNSKFGDLGATDDAYKCGSCNKTKTELVTPK